MFFCIIALTHNKDSVLVKNPVYVRQQSSIEKNDWSVFSTSKDSSFLKVSYQEKYGFEKTVYCKVIFENTKTGEYKCISPELGCLILQKSNLNSFKVTEVKNE